MGCPTCFAAQLEPLGTGCIKVQVSQTKAPVQHCYLLDPLLPELWQCPKLPAAQVCQVPATNPFALRCCSQWPAAVLGLAFVLGTQGLGNRSVPTQAAQSLLGLLKELFELLCSGLLFTFFEGSMRT